MHFGEKPVEIASATEDSHVPSSAPLSLLIPTAEKENKHAGLMEKKCSVKEINKDWKHTAELNRKADSINLKQLEEDAS